MSYIYISWCSKLTSVTEESAAEINIIENDLSHIDKMADHVGVIHIHQLVLDDH